ncbi:MAG: flagellar filament outer layer protein FlaA [Treponema sp.]|nr:flagellar filament outer layer protein FlaA [Treponema sp.]MBR4631477.1 flagellar filament outer layer protein FlaA [Treponema sp.]
MKKTLVLSAAAMMLAGAAFAKESTLIDFTLLDADITVKMSDNDAGDKPNENKRTVMDYSIAAGATYSQEQKDLMKTSLFIEEWEVELNSSARNVGSLALSQVKAAPVRDNAKVPFAGKKVMGVRVVFPSLAANANAKIVPPFSIPAYEPLSTADDNGDRQQPTDEEKASGRTLFEADSDDTPAYGVVKNVGTIKSIAATTLGMNFPHGLYVLLGDVDGNHRRYFMGYLGFDGWKTLTWNNPEYISEVRTREVRVYPIYPRGLPFVKFEGFQITRDAAHVGDDFIGYFKDVKIIYDKAELTTERDIADEDLWGIVTKKEKARQNAEMTKFGNKQVNRYIERSKMATEESFTSSLTEGSASNAQSNGGQTTAADDAK